MLLPAVTSAQVIRALYRAGFVDDKKHGRKQALWNPMTGARTEVLAGEVKESSLRATLKSAHLGIHKFLGLLGKK